MASVKGKNGKVTVGAADSTVSLMGTWTISGATADQLEETAFGDDYKKYVMGLLDGGTVSFSGLLDPADANGQTVLRDANNDSTLLTSIKFWQSATSYWQPSYTSVTGSGVYITSWEIGAERAGLITASFTGKVTGKIGLV